MRWHSSSVRISKQQMLMSYFRKGDKQSDRWKTILYCPVLFSTVCQVCSYLVWKSFGRRKAFNSYTVSKFYFQLTINVVPAALWYCWPTLMIIYGLTSFYIVMYWITNFVSVRIAHNQCTYRETCSLHKLLEIQNPRKRSNVLSKEAFCCFPSAFIPGNLFNTSWN